MSEQQQATPANAEPQVTENQPAQPDINTQLGNALWNDEQPKPAEQAPPTSEPPKEEEFKYVDPNEYVKEQLGVDSWDALKQKWEEFNKPKDPTATELKFANEQSQKFFELLKEGKQDDVYNFLHQQKQLDRLNSLPVANTNEAIDIIKADLQFKYPHIKPDDIDFMISDKYAKPAKPVQGADQEDADYQAQLSSWQQRVNNIERKMMIDAQVAKPELAKYKSELVLPDIAQPQSQEPDQKALEAQEAFRTNFQQKLGSDYQNFKGFNVTAKDGDVQLPITYAISPEELASSKQMLENLNVNEFLDSRWFDEQGNPKINQMQEDLYLLTNRDKVFQKIANEAATQRFLHHQKIQNNVNIKGVNSGAPPVSAQLDTKAQEQQMAEFLWKM